MTLREVAYSFQERSINLYDTKLSFNKLSYLTYFYVKSFVLDNSEFPFKISMKMNLNEFIILKLKKYYDHESPRRIQINSEKERERIINVFDNYVLLTEESLISEIKRETWYSKISHLKNNKNQYYHITLLDLLSSPTENSHDSRISNPNFIDDEYIF